ncbi:MAG: hypothetical protein PHX83_11040 [Acidobacteriia bacterium]|nr:hypothetical protein [Terriglobia bacterium]
MHNISRPSTIRLNSFDLRSACLRRGFPLLLFLFFLAFFEPVGCGKVGPPLPPEILIPRPVADLTSQQIGNAIRLSWTLPTANTNGSKATTVEKIEVYRQLIPKSAPLPSSAEVAKSFSGSKILSISMDHIDAFTDRGKVVFADNFPGLGMDQLNSNRLGYAVKVVNKKGQDAGFSNIIIRLWLKVPPPIDHIDFKAEESVIHLSWNASAGVLSSQVPFLGYNIYRSEQSKVLGFTPLNDHPLDEPRFDDRNFQFGTTYYYTVRCVVGEKTLLAESADSPEFSFKPVDVFPPKTPTGLTAIIAAGKINLSWDANLENDLAGYIVYRSEDGTHFTRLTETPVKSVTLRDDTALPNKTYYYRVTAIDTSNNESPPSATTSVSPNPAGT